MSAKNEVSKEDTNTPEAVHFVQIATDIFALEFPDIWKLGQSYFKGIGTPEQLAEVECI